MQRNGRRILFHERRNPQIADDSAVGFDFLEKAHKIGYFGKVRVMRENIDGNIYFFVPVMDIFYRTGKLIEIEVIGKRAQAVFFIRRTSRSIWRSCSRRRRRDSTH